VAHAAIEASRAGSECGGVAMVRRQLPLEHTDREMYEIESSRQAPRLRSPWHTNARSWQHPVGAYHDQPSL